MYVETHLIEILAVFWFFKRAGAYWLTDVVDTQGC